MVKGAIKIECEFKTRTPLGIATCSADMNVFNNFEEEANRVVAWCSKAMNSHSISSPVITFTFGDGSLYGVSTSRYYYDFCDTYALVKWGRNGDTEVVENMPKQAGRFFKKLYLECVERMKEVVE